MVTGDDARKDEGVEALSERVEGDDWKVEMALGRRCTWPKSAMVWGAWREVRIVERGHVGDMRRKTRCRCRDTASADGGMAMGHSVGDGMGRKTTTTR